MRNMHPDALEALEMVASFLEKTKSHFLHIFQNFREAEDTNKVVKLHDQVNGLFLCFERKKDEKFPSPYPVLTFVENDDGNPFYYLYLYLSVLCSPLFRHYFVDELSPFLSLRVIQVTRNEEQKKLIDVNLLLPFHQHQKNFVHSGDDHHRVADC